MGNAHGGAEAVQLTEIYLYDIRNSLWFTVLQVIGGLQLTREKWSRLRVLCNIVIAVIQSYSKF